MANISFDQLMEGFGVVTVFDACIYVPTKSYTSGCDCALGPTNEVSAFTPDDFVFSGESIDTLKIANLTQEGPTKEIKGGKYANTLIKYGKTCKIEMQDALGRARTLERFFGCDYDGYAEYSVDDTIAITTEFEIPNGDKTDSALKVKVNGTLKTASTDYTVSATKPIISFLEGKLPSAGDIVQIECTGKRLSVGDKFPGPFALEGKTFFIDQKTGEQKPVFIWIPQLSPDAILTLTQDAEGDATVFDLNGSVNVTDIADDSSKPSRSVFYEIREESFFAARAAQAAQQ